MDLRDLLQQVVQYSASDLHLTEGMPPIFRIDGEPPALISATSVAQAVSPLPEV